MQPPGMRISIEIAYNDSGKASVESIKYDWFGSPTTSAHDDGLSAAIRALERLLAESRTVDATEQVIGEARRFDGGTEGGEPRSPGV